MGLFIGASILTVLELFDYAYEVSGVGCGRGTGGAGFQTAHPPATLLPSQVIKHKLCRRGKCQKEAKRSSADKGVALSLDDVKRHVRERERRALQPHPLPDHPRTTPLATSSPLPPPRPGGTFGPSDNQSLSCALPPEPVREPPGPSCRDDVCGQHPTSPSGPRHF